MRRENIAEIRSRWVQEPTRVVVYTDNAEIWQGNIHHSRQFKSWAGYLAGLDVTHQCLGFQVLQFVKFKFSVE